MCQLEIHMHRSLLLYVSVCKHVYVNISVYLHMLLWMYLDGYVCVYAPIIITTDSLATQEN